MKFLKVLAVVLAAVPALEPAMEQYSIRDGLTIEGKATYARFRRYVVAVDQTLAPPKK